MAVIGPSGHRRSYDHDDGFLEDQSIGPTRTGRLSAPHTFAAAWSAGRRAGLGAVAPRSSSRQARDLTAPTDTTPVQSEVRTTLRTLHESQQISEGLYRRAASSVIPLLDGRTRVPVVTADDQEDEVSFFWMFAGRRAEISVPDVGRIYVNVDGVGSQKGLEGFFDVLPALAVSERLAALEAFARRRDEARN